MKAGSVTGRLFYLGDAVFNRVKKPAIKNRRSRNNLKLVLLVTCILNMCKYA